MIDQTRIRILAVDDHPLLRQGIATLIGSQPDLTLISETSSGAEGIQQYRKHRPEETIRHVHAGRKRIPPEVAARLTEHFSDETLSAREVDVLRHLVLGTQAVAIAVRRSIVQL